MYNFFNESIKKSKNIAVKDVYGHFKTYQDIFTEAEMWKQVLKTRNVVCILCDNSFETVCFIFEMFVCGQVPLVLSEDIDETLIVKLLEAYRPNYIWCGQKNHFPQKKKLQTMEKVMHCSEHQLYQMVEEPYDIHPDLALLLSTSGSTGTPKLVRLSYDNLLNRVLITEKLFQNNEKNKTILTLPLNGIFCMSFCIEQWYYGATVLVTDVPVMSSRFKEFYVKERVNNFIGVPFTYQMLQRTGFWDRETLSSLNFARVGGARLEAEDLKWLVSVLKDKFWVSYGQTETTALVISTNFENSSSKLGTVGKPLHGVEVSLSEKQELIIHSKSVCMGYSYGYEDLCKPDENHGMLHTGDLAYIDEDGFIFLKGRLQRYINILGNRMNMDELERLLHESFSDLGLICAGEDDKLILFSEKEQVGKYEKDIRQYLMEKFKISFKMVSLMYIEQIPHMGNGKVDYLSLKEMTKAISSRK